MEIWNHAHRLLDTALVSTKLFGISECNALKMDITWDESRMPLFGDVPGWTGMKSKEWVKARAVH